MAKWALALRQTTTYLGLVAIAIIWVGIYLLSSEQRQLAYQDALRQGVTLRGSWKSTSGGWCRNPITHYWR